MRAGLLSIHICEGEMIMKKKTQWLVFGVVGIICIASLSSLLYWMCVLHPSINAGGSPNIPTAAFNSSKQGDNYMITVVKISFSTEPSDIRWYVCNESGCSIASNDFPITSGDAGSSTNKSIIVTWFDNDHDDRLSKNDTIRVYRSWHNLDGCTFRLFYKTYNEIACVKFQ